MVREQAGSPPKSRRTTSVAHWSFYLVAHHGRLNMSDGLDFICNKNVTPQNFPGRVTAMANVGATSSSTKRISSPMMSDVPHKGSTWRLMCERSVRLEETPPYLLKAVNAEIIQKIEIRQKASWTRLPAAFPGGERRQVLFLGIPFFLIDGYNLCQRSMESCNARTYRVNPSPPPPPPGMSLDVFLCLSFSESQGLSFLFCFIHYRAKIKQVYGSRSFEIDSSVPLICLHFTTDVARQDRVKDEHADSLRILRMQGLVMFGLETK